jgi:hypothetical protein
MLERRPNESDESYAKRLNKSEAAKAARRAKAAAKAAATSMSVMSTASTAVPFESPSKKRRSSDGSSGSGGSKSRQSKKSKKDKEKKPRKLRNGGVLKPNCKNVVKVVQRFDYGQARQMLNEQHLWVRQTVDLPDIKFLSFPSYILLTKNGSTPDLNFSNNDLDFIKLISDLTTQRKITDLANPFFHPDSSGNTFWDYLFSVRHIAEPYLHKLWQIMIENDKYVDTMIAHARKHGRLHDLKAAVPNLSSPDSHFKLRDAK